MGAGDEARDALILCGIQRHLQALGAYGFLCAIRGKAEFLKYISPALKLLREEVAQVDSTFPTLSGLLETLSGMEYGQ